MTSMSLHFGYSQNYSTIMPCLLWADSYSSYGSYGDNKSPAIHLHLLHRRPFACGKQSSQTKRALVYE